MILVDIEDPAVRVNREMEADPTFVPCRDERCSESGLHREHAIKSTRASYRRRQECPMCGSRVRYVATGAHQRAHCHKCPWRGYFVKNPKKETESARDQP